MASQQPKKKTMFYQKYNIFQKNSYVGFDKISKNNKVVLGLQHVYKRKTDDKFFSISLGQVFYVNKQKDHLNPFENSDSAPLILEFNTFLTGGVWSKGMVELDKQFNKVSSAYFGLVYRGDEQKRIELRSVYRRKDFNIGYIPWADKENATNQVELITHLPITKSFSVFGRLQKDLEFNKSNDILFGFQYSNCCMKFGLMHRKWVDEDYFSWRLKYDSAYEALYEGLDPSRERGKTYLFFELKDLGRLGKQISRVISSTKLE